MTCASKCLGKKSVKSLSFDIILDEDLKPWLLEVNHTPSFTTDTPLDLQIKRHLIMDTLVLANIKNKTKKMYFWLLIKQLLLKKKTKLQQHEARKRARKGEISTKSTKAIKLRKIPLRGIFNDLP